jgi:hypothetical protein
MKFYGRKGFFKKKSRYTNVTAKYCFLVTFWRKNFENSLLLDHICFFGPSSLLKAWKLPIKGILFRTLRYVDSYKIVKENNSVGWREKTCFCAYLEFKSVNIFWPLVKHNVTAASVLWKLKLPGGPVGKITGWPNTDNWYLRLSRMLSRVVWELLTDVSGNYILPILKCQATREEFSLD